MTFPLNNITNVSFHIISIHLIPIRVQPTFETVLFRFVQKLKLIQMAKMSFWRKNYPYIIVGTIVVYHFGMNFIDYSFERKAKIAEAEAERLKRIKEI